jgi:Predicted permeases
MLAGLSYETIGFIWLGTLLGGIAAGGTGFAFGLVASAIWLHRIDPLQSGILIAGCGLLLHVTTIWQQRQHVEPARIWPLVVGGLVGVPIGVHFLAYTDAAMLKILLAVFLIVFGTYALLAPKLRTITGGGRPADVLIGFLGGILGGLGGYSGVLPTIWTQLRGWPKEMARAVYQPYVIVMQAVTLAGILWVAFDRADLRLLIVILPPLFLGTWVGWKLYGKLDDRRFRQAIAVLLIASGVSLIV